jgi:hypothetical protein
LCVKQRRKQRGGGGGGNERREEREEKKKEKGKEKTRKEERAGREKWIEGRKYRNEGANLALLFGSFPNLRHPVLLPGALGRNEKMDLS